MPEFKLSKETGTKKFEIQMAIDYSEDEEVELIEFWNGVDWSENLGDLRLNNSFCDEDEQDEWNNYFNDVMHLLESGELVEELSKLKEEDDYFFFDEEDIKAILTYED